MIYSPLVLVTSWCRMHLQLLFIVSNNRSGQTGFISQFIKAWPYDSIFRHILDIRRYVNRSKHYYVLSVLITIDMITSVESWLVMFVILNIIKMK